MGFKDLYGVGGAPGTAGGDEEWYTGKIQSWDEISGANTVIVNGVPLPNLKVVQSGIGIAYQPGDVVVVQRIQTIYTVFGKVVTPGTGSNNQIQSQTVATYQTTGSTSYIDLGTYGPSVTVNVSSSRRCLVMVSAFITFSGTIATNGGNIGGTASVITTGASSIGHDLAFAKAEGQALVQYAGPTYGAGNGLSGFGMRVFTAADGLNAGSNTFTVQYKSDTSSPVCGFQQRTLTVIPF